ncbi:hypothetical protein ES708_30144 [subsurface metagenome]
MPKLRGPLLSLSARGRLGRLFALVRRGGRNIIERRPIPTDAKSPAQLFSRHMFSKCVALWHLLSEAEKQEWESLARPRHMTGYAWYISQCLRPNPGIYLPLQGGTMAGNIEMAKNRLLKLPEPTDAQEAATKGYVDALTKVIWKDASETAMDDSNRTASLPYTLLCLTPYTSPNAKLAILMLRMRPDTVGSGLYSQLFIRKNDTLPASLPRLILDKAGTSPYVYHYCQVIIGLDSSQFIEYNIWVGTGWQVDSQINVLGYIES